MKKITKKQALSLALAGLMLAPSVPIQSFAQGSGTNRISATSTTLTPGKTAYKWEKYSLKPNIKISNERYELELYSRIFRDRFGTRINSYFVVYDTLKLKKWSNEYTIVGDRLESIYKNSLYSPNGSNVNSFSKVTDYVKNCLLKPEYYVMFSNSIDDTVYTDFRPERIEQKNNGDDVYWYTAKKVQLDENNPCLQGSYLGMVYSENKSDYPENGEKDGFWYVSKGVVTEAENFTPQIEKVTVEWGKPVDLKSGIKNIPEDAKVEDITNPAIDTKKSGNQTAKAKITFSDSSTKEVTIPVTVSKSESENFTPQLQNVTAIKGSPCDITKAITNLPEGATVKEKTPVDTSTKGDKKGVVTITFTDGSTKDVDVPVTVKALEADEYTPQVKEADSPSYEDVKGAITNLPDGAKVDIVSKPERTAYTPEFKELKANLNERVDLTKAVTNPKGGVTITEKTPVDTSKLGKQTGTITVTFPEETKPANAKITFQDGSTKDVVVQVKFKPEGRDYPVTVNVEFNPKINTSPTAEEKDIINSITDLPEGSTVKVVSTPKHSYTPNVQPITVKPGEKVDLTKALMNPQKDVEVVEKTPVDTKTPGIKTGTITITVPEEKGVAKAKVTLKDGSIHDVDVPVIIPAERKDYPVAVNVVEDIVKITVHYLDFGNADKEVLTRTIKAKPGDTLDNSKVPELFGYELDKDNAFAAITVAKDTADYKVRVKNLYSRIETLSGKIAALEKEKKTLQESLAKAEKQATDNQAEIDKLKEALKAKDAEIAKLKEEKGKQDALITELQKKLDYMKNDLKNANEALAQSKKDLEDLQRELQGKINALNNQIADKEAKGKDLEKQLADEKAKGNADQGKIAELEQAIKDNNEAKDALANEKDALAKELADKEAQIKTLTDNAKKLEGNIKDLEQKIKDLVDGKAVSEEALKEVQTKLDKAEADKAQLQKDLDALKDELNAKIKALEDELEASKGQNTKDANKIKALEDDVKAKTKEIEKLKGQIGQQNSLIAELQKKLDNMKSDLKAANDALAKSKDDLDAFKKDLKGKIDKLNGQIADKEAKGKDLEKQLADEKAKGNADQGKIAELEKAIKDNKNEKDALTGEKDALNKELANKEAQIKELTENAAKLEGNVKDLEQKIKDLLSDKGVTSDKIQALLDEIAKLKKDNKDLVAQSKDLQDNLKKAEDVSKEKDATINALTYDSAKKDREIYYLRKEANYSYKRDEDKLRNELKELIKQAEKMDKFRLTYKEKIALDTAIDAAKKVLNDIKATDKDVAKAIKDLKTELKTYKPYLFDDTLINKMLGKNIKSLDDFIAKVQRAIGGSLVVSKKVSNDDTTTALKYIFMIDSNRYAQATNKSIKIYQMDVRPFIRNDKTMLPMRYVAYVLGADVEWDNSTRTAIFTKDDMVAKINIDGGSTIQVNGQSIQLSAKPEISHDRIFVPLTDISKVFGVTNGNVDDGINQDIEWNNTNRTVTVHIAR